MKIAVLGAGRWGSFLSWYMARMGHQVVLWGRSNSDRFIQLKNKRRNEYLKLPDTIAFTDQLDKAVAESDIVVIAINSQELRNLAIELNTLHLGKRTIVLCMKGIEVGSGKRLTQIINEEITQPISTAIWVGPGHVQDFINGIPNCMVIGSENINTTKQLVKEFGSDLIRFYYGQDIIGNEIGAAAKNVIGIAAGMLDGLSYSSLKGALMARGAREISRLVRVMGGNELTVYGLSHLGDYAVTLYSDYSHNRTFGEAYVKGCQFDKLAEGVATAQALVFLANRYDLELPICESVNQIIHNKEDAKQVLLQLFFRPVKFEF